MKISSLFLVTCLAFVLYRNTSSMSETNGFEDLCDDLRVIEVNRIKDLLSQKMGDGLLEPSTSTVTLSDCDGICSDICREFSSDVASNCCDIKCGESCADQSSLLQIFYLIHHPAKLGKAESLDLKTNNDGYISLEKRHVIIEDPIVGGDKDTTARRSLFLDISIQNGYCPAFITNCILESFQVQPNFNLSMYLGKWYTQKWLPQFYIPPEELFQDYTHNYVLNNNGSVTTYISARDPVDLKQCFSYTMLLETTNMPGKLRRTIHINGAKCTVGCLVETFQVQPNFNLSMYLGKWYEQKWLPQSYIPPEELFQDYTHNYVLNNNGSVTTYISGRDPVDLKKCFSYTMLMETTNTPAKLRRTVNINATTSMVSDYWVMKTDYTGYTVVYGCRERNVLGRCTYPDSWVWSRTPQLNVDQWAIINTTIEDLCLQGANFLATQQANECTVALQDASP